MRMSGQANSFKRLLPAVDEVKLKEAIECSPALLVALFPQNAATASRRIDAEVERTCCGSNSTRPRRSSDATP